jgi:hypothetical protein
MRGHRVLLNDAAVSYPLERGVSVCWFVIAAQPGGEPRLAATRENGQVQLTLTGKQGAR